MPASLDSTQQRVILTVTTVATVLILGVVGYAGWFELPRLEKLLQQSSLSKNYYNNNNTSNNNLFVGCWKTIIAMAVATFVLTWPIMRQENPLAAVDAQTLTSSINFCEPDFRHSRYIAEPANTISSVVSYIPLAFLGAVFQHSYEFGLAYTALLMIGIGSTLLHAFLTAVTQGGDELPILWYLAAVSFCACGVLFPKLPGTGAFISLTVFASTLIYVRNRNNFIFFYIIFSTYAFTLIASLIYISLFMNWDRIPEGTRFKKWALLPLARACAFLALAAIWVWVGEMVGCAHASDQETGTAVWHLWHTVLHPTWHVLSGILAFMLVQVFYAAQGFLGGRGIPSIIWAGAPVVVFERPTAKID